MWLNIYSNKFINLISIIITIIIFFTIFFVMEYLRTAKSDKTISKEDIIKEKEDDDILIQDILANEEQNEEKKDNYNWSIEIRSIDLKAPIAETTEMKVLNNFIGHFEETALTIGNIGLAGHNRGYENNYFQDLKKVKKDDEIIYTYNDFTKTYIVNTIEIIRNTDWRYLENTEENMITLITCTENEPEYRLCVQAVEKNDSI